MLCSALHFSRTRKKTQMARNSTKAHPALAQLRAGQDREAHLIMACKNAAQTCPVTNFYGPDRGSDPHLSSLIA